MPGPALPRRSAAAYLTAFGSLCFFVAAMSWYLALAGPIATNITFAVGSGCYTASGILGLYFSGRRRPGDDATRGDRLDWWASVVQLAGSLLFLVSILLAFAASLAAPDAVGVGWRGDAWGSIAFVTSSALGLAAMRRRDELWDPNARTPAASWLSLIGSALFLLAAIAAYVFPATHAQVSVWWEGAGTVLGAACFFVAVLLPVPVGATSDEPVIRA